MTNQNNNSNNTNNSNNKQIFEREYKNGIAQDSNIKSERSPLEITMLATQTNDTRIKIANSMPQDGQEYKK